MRQAGAAVDHAQERIDHVLAVQHRLPGILVAGVAGALVAVPLAAAANAVALHLAEIAEPPSPEELDGSVEERQPS